MGPLMNCSGLYRHHILMCGQKKRLRRTVRPLQDEDETIGIDLGQPKPSMHQGERNEEVIMERLEPFPARICPHWSEVIIGFCRNLDSP